MLIARAAELRAVRQRLNMNTDLRDADFGQFCDFVFARPVSRDPASKWYWDLSSEVCVDPSRAVSYLTELCQGPRDLLDDYTPAQIAEGLGYLFGPGGGSTFRDQLWNPEVAWEDRKRCIELLPRMHFELFEEGGEGFGDLPFMLWDLIAFGYDAGTREASSSLEDARVQTEMYKALCTMLESDNAVTQRSAIHGLAHLRHSGGDSALRTFLKGASRLERDVKSYAEGVLEGHWL